jgi:hypothetical protein
LVTLGSTVKLVVRVTVSAGARRHFENDGAAGPATVIDHNLLAPSLVQSLAGKARHDVAAAAWVHGCFPHRFPSAAMFFSPRLFRSGCSSSGTVMVCSPLERHHRAHAAGCRRRIMVISSHMPLCHPHIR